MGTKRYTLEDYRDRVLLKVYEYGTVPVEFLVSEVKGTNTRVIEGLLLLVMEDKVFISVDNEQIHVGII